jgi:hypothetical protein
MPFFKLLHILSMFAMVTIEIGAEFLYAYALSRGDVRTLATVHRISERARLGRWSVVALIAGILFGLLTAATGGFLFFEGWLIAAYVLIGVLLVTVTMFLRRALPLGQAAVEADEGRRPADDLVRDMRASRAFLWFGLDVLILAAIIADMVLKPL